MYGKWYISFHHHPPLALCMLMSSTDILYCLWPCSLAITSNRRVGLLFLWFYVQEHPKAQPPVVLVLKRLTRWGHSLKSHPTDWEKLGIKPATSGLQDIGLPPTPRRLLP